MFQPPAIDNAASTTVPHARYRAADGAELHAYVVGERRPGGAIVLVFHGNAEVSPWRVPWARRFVVETGACVVLAEYRGYDGLAGTPSYESSRHDARAALAYVRHALRADPASIVFFGHSLGSAVAAELAVEQPPRSLILQSPFSSAREMSKRMVIPLPWRLVSRVHFDTLARVKSVRSPAYVAHGDRDRIIPVRMGRAVFAAARSRGELLIVNGAGHNDVPETGGAEYWAWMRRAVRAERGTPEPATVDRGAAPPGP